MNFIIRQHSTLPKIEIPIDKIFLEKNGLTLDQVCDSYPSFSMVDADTGQYKIANKSATILEEKQQVESSSPYKYTLTYKFTKKETAKVGRYRGEFKLLLSGDNCGTITIPNTSELCISIKGSITNTEFI